MIDVKVGDRVYLMTGGGEKASVNLLRPLFPPFLLDRVCVGVVDFCCVVVVVL